MMNLDEVGAHVDVIGRLFVRFGIYLPNITVAKGYQLIVRVIHEKDQFVIEIPAKNFLLTFDERHPLALWSGMIDLTQYKDSLSHFGMPGTYLYRYTLLQQQQPGGDTSNQMTLSVFDPATTVQRDLMANVVTLFVTDPFARNTGIGKLSAFTVSDQPMLPFRWTDADFVVPELDDLIVYELQVEEFDSTFDGVAQRLDYLLGLGVNVLELMPITSVPQIFDWGYGPLHFFAPEDRWGGLDGFKRLVDACHSKGIAVILDVVYQHVSADFAYDLVYQNSHEVGPMGTFPNGDYGPKTTFEGMPFTQEFFRTSNQYCSTSAISMGSVTTMLPATTMAPPVRHTPNWSTTPTRTRCRSRVFRANEASAVSFSALSTSSTLQPSCAKPTPTRPGRMPCSAKQRIWRGATTSTTRLSTCSTPTSPAIPRRATLMVSRLPSHPFSISIHTITST